MLEGPGGVRIPVVAHDLHRVGVRRWHALGVEVSRERLVDHRRDEPILIAELPIERRRLDPGALADLAGRDIPRL
jgi:hypothetical protein